MTGPMPPTDADLIALLHGELPPLAAQRLLATVAADPALQARHRALAAVDAALAEALDQPAAPAASRRPWAPWWRAGLALVALLVVGFVPFLARDPAHAAHNDLLGLRVVPQGGVRHPLLTAVPLDLHWQKRATDEHCQRLEVHPLAFGQDLAELGRSLAAAGGADRRVVAPLALTATLHAPDGSHRPATVRFAGPPVLVNDTLVQTLTVTDFELQLVDPPTYVGGNPLPRAWGEDFLWAYRHMPKYAPHRWLPSEPGEWTIEVQVRSVPPPTAGAWPGFAEPLVVAVKVLLTGVVSDWGEAHDGLQARLVVATEATDPDRTPFAIQIQNRSGRTRAYNVTGTTIAPIPQPFHFVLLVDRGQGLEPCQPRGRVGVITASEDLMIDHPDGTVRTLVASLDYWRCGELRLGELPRPLRLAALFHSEPSAWNGNDTTLWMGRLPTPAVTLPAAR